MHASLLLLTALVSQGDAVDSTRVYEGRGRPAVEIPRLEPESEITIDGILDEAPWRTAAVLSGFSQYQPVDGRPAEERTEVLVWYSPTAIHFGVVAYDRQPGAVRATLADRDEIDGDDNVTIYLDTFDDRRRAFVFAVNPLGVQQDGVRSEGSNSAGSLFGGSIDESPDFIWQSKGRRTAEGYVVEIRIPFKSLRYPGGEQQRWGINVVRVTQRTGYTDTWTDVRRASASFLGQSGHLVGLHGLKRGVVVEAQPFVTASAVGGLDTSGRFDREAIDGSAGLNLKLGFTKLAIDATVNPDFSQVEADAGVVTVNERFDIFFAEQRPFFLEGIELFATPNNLVYTRRIADPSVGGKVTGKFGRLSVAHLTALDELPESDDALFNVTRLRGDLGTNSTAGVTYTDRLAGDDYNRVLSADARVVFGGLYFAQAQLGRSWDRTGDARQGGELWEAEFDRTGRAWGFNYKLTGIDDDFVTRSGFVNRTGIVRGNAFNRLTWYGARGALVETVNTFVGLNRLWHYGDFLSDGTIEGEESVSLELTLRGGWSLQAEGRRAFVDFDPAEYAGHSVGGGAPAPFVPPAGVSNAFGGELSINTPTYRHFDAGIDLAFGETAIFPEAGEGRQLGLGAYVAVRPAPTLRAELQATYDRLTRRRDGSEFARTIIPRLRLEYQPTRALFFRVIGEYYTARVAALVDPRTGAPLLVGGAPQPATTENRLRVDWLASFEPTPGTVAYFGYGSNMAADRAFDLGGLRRTEDGFFVKLAYLFRR